MLQKHCQGLHCACSEIAQDSPSQGRALRRSRLPLYLQARALRLHPASQRMHFRFVGGKPWPIMARGTLSKTEKVQLPKQLEIPVMLTVY